MLKFIIIIISVMVAWKLLKLCIYELTGTHPEKVKKSAYKLAASRVSFMDPSVTEKMDFLYKKAAFQIKKGIYEQRKIRFSYNGHKRTIHPYLTDAYHVYGYCEYKKEPRMFCLDNILYVTVARDKFEKDARINRYLVEEKSIKRVHAMKYDAWNRIN